MRTPRRQERARAATDEDSDPLSSSDEDGETLELLSLPTKERDHEAGPGRAGTDLSFPDDEPRAVPLLADDETVDEAALTLRSLLIGASLCILGASISQLFFFRSNAPSFSSFFITLVAYPLGQLLASILPEKKVKIGVGSWSWRVQLNPGPFTKKEHVLAVVFAASGSSASYAGEIISVQTLYYHQELPTIAGLLLLLSTQLIGFGLAGLTYPLLVRPVKMRWPAALVFVDLFNTLHQDGGEQSSGGSSSQRSRLRLFSLAFAAVFVWQFVPSYFFPTLSSIATLCLLFPSRTSSVLSSGYQGFGWLNLSLDWAVIGATGPLVSPWFASASYFGGALLSMYVLAPALYFSNWWDSRSFDSPVAAHLYNSTFGRFDVLSVVTPQLTLNRTVWETAGPILLTPYFALSYGISFAVLSSAVVTVALWNWEDIADAFNFGGAKSIGKRELSTGGGTVAVDQHVERFERNYPGVPTRFYVLCFVTMLTAASYIIIAYPILQLPFFGLLLALGMSAVFLVPLGILAALTNVTIGLNVGSELVAGLLFPQQPISNIVFKTYSYMSLVQAIDLSSDLKLGLYMNIPPRAMFICQVLGTALGATTNYSLIRGIIASKRGFLDGTEIDPTAQWTGRKPEIFYSASVIWGLVGPTDFFGGKYQVLFWGFLIGALLPLIPWLLHRRYPHLSIFGPSFSVPLILHGMMLPPQTPTNVILCGLLAAYASQFHAVRYYPRAHKRFNYVLSAALDAGTSVNALMIYAVGIPSFMTWWGNSAVDTEHCL